LGDSLGERSPESSSSVALDINKYTVNIYILYIYIYIYIYTYIYMYIYMIYTYIFIFINVPLGQLGDSLGERGSEESLVALDVNKYTVNILFIYIYI